MRTIAAACYWILVLLAPAAAGITLAPEVAWQAAWEARTEGPAEVPLGDRAVLHLPAGYLFLPQTEARNLMESWGNQVGPGFAGLVTAASPDELWFIGIDHTAEGFVADDEARDWDRDALLDGLRTGTEAQNQRRLEMGLPALDIKGWVEAPAYDAAAHRLVWSVAAATRGAPAGTPDVINFNTYALGRDGYFELDLMTDAAHVAADKDDAALILAALEYNRGKRYQDYVAGTDKVAQYGIAALVGGLAAKKLGLIALAGVFVLKFAKLFAIGAIALLAIGSRFFRRGGSS